MTQGFKHGNWKLAPQKKTTIYKTSGSQKGWFAVRHEFKDVLLHNQKKPSCPISPQRAEIGLIMRCTTKSFPIVTLITMHSDHGSKYKTQRWDAGYSGPVPYNLVLFLPLKIAPIVKK